MMKGIKALVANVCTNMNIEVEVLLVDVSRFFCCAVDLNMQIYS